MKIAAGVEYCGLNFFGWQRQSHAPSVQQHVEEALSKVADHPIRVHCAGRTDTGVHALQQVIHFESTAQRQMHSWLFGSNVNMSAGVSLTWVQQAGDDFHARFSATGRTYRYIILNRPARPALGHGLVTWEKRPLDIDLMTAAAVDLVGKHDFTSYRTQSCQAKSPVREIRRLDIFRKGEYIIFEIAADAFLHHMVRNIAGVLMTIGRGDQAPGWAKQVLQARDRKVSGMTASAHGLYLIDVEYPVRFNLPNKRLTQWPLLADDLTFVAE
ncbi:MAG: tRNA pseudouridine(38-40) synthase TruA [Gammaproteobacteria bacterium]|nr:tRNA pseudouridine(38-40) synthase TruA [Gammaproteobacteria bacterium]